MGRRTYKMKTTVPWYFLQPDGETETEYEVEVEYYSGEHYHVGPTTASPPDSPEAEVQEISGPVVKGKTAPSISHGDWEKHGFTDKVIKEIEDKVMEEPPEPEEREYEPEDRDENRGLGRVRKLVESVRKMLSENVRDEIDLKKVPEAQRTGIKKKLEALGVKFLDEIEPGYWEVEGPDTPEITRVLMDADPEDVEDLLYEQRSDLTDASEDADWEYSIGSVAGADPDVGSMRAEIEEVSDVSAEFTWTTKTPFKPEEILTALDKWKAARKPIRITKSIEAEDDRGRVYASSGLSIELDSKNTKVTMKKPGEYEFKISGDDVELGEDIGGKGVKLRAGISFQTKPGSSSIEWEAGDDVELVRKERAKDGCLQITLKKGDNSTTLQYDNEGEMRKHLQMESGVVDGETVEQFWDRRTPDDRKSWLQNLSIKGPFGRAYHAWEVSKKKFSQLPEEIKAHLKNLVPRKTFGVQAEGSDMATLNKLLGKIMVGVAKQLGADETADELADTGYEGERFAAVVDGPVYNELQELEREIRTDMERVQGGGRRYDPKHLSDAAYNMGEDAANQIMIQAMDNLMDFVPREKHKEIAGLRDRYWKIPGVKQFEQAVVREAAKIINKYKKEENQMPSPEKNVMQEWRRMALGKGGVTEATSEMGGVDIVPPGFTFPDPLAFYGYAVQKLPLTIKRSIDRMPPEGQKAMVELLSQLGGLKEATVKLVEIFETMTDAIDKYDGGSIEGREVARVFRYLMDASRFAQGGAEIAETL